MRIRFLHDVDHGRSTYAEGAEILCRPGPGERFISRGQAAEVLPDGKLRRRRGAPKRVGTSRDPDKKPRKAAAKRG